MTTAVPEAWLKRAPRLDTIAAWVNENTRMVAIVEPGFCNTDRQIGRLRWPGKGRTGRHIKVWQCQEHVDELRQHPVPRFAADAHPRKFPHMPLIDHNSAETYRVNSEVVTRLVRFLEENPEAWR